MPVGAGMHLGLRGSSSDTLSLAVPRLSLTQAVPSQQGLPILPADMQPYQPHNYTFRQNLETPNDFESCKKSDTWVPCADIPPALVWRGQCKSDPEVVRKTRF